MANIIIFFIISLSFFDNLCFVSSFDNLCFVGSFDNIRSFLVCLVPLILILPGSLGSFSFYYYFWFVGFFDNLWFVGSFDNTLVFFLLIIINLWFVCFFDDSIRVRLVTLHYIKQKCLPEASWLYWCH